MSDYGRALCHVLGRLVGLPPGWADVGLALGPKAVGSLRVQALLGMGAIGYILAFLLLAVPLSFLLVLAAMLPQGGGGGGLTIRAPPSWGPRIATPLDSGHTNCQGGASSPI